MPDGKTCKEVNYLSKEPPAYFTDPDIAFIGRLNRKVWQEAESKLRTFTIENIYILQGAGIEMYIDKNNVSNIVIRGSIHTAEIIDKNKLIVRIL